MQLQVTSVGVEGTQHLRTSSWERREERDEHCYHGNDLTLPALAPVSHSIAVNRITDLITTHMHKGL